MLLGNKCDVEAKRKVSRETGEKVSWGGVCGNLMCNYAASFEALTVRSDCESVEMTFQAKREWLFEEGLKMSRGFCGCAHVYFR